MSHSRTQFISNHISIPQFYAIFGSNIRIAHTILKKIKEIYEPSYSVMLFKILHKER